MDSGVHIGLAAWLHHRCDGEGFLAWPAAPVSMQLARLEGAENSQDMARVAEFSRLVNFVARPGRPAQPFASQPLWSVHAGVLQRMQFAQRAWTDAENETFLRARAVLYGDDGTTTPLFQLYQEFRAAYDDLLLAGASAEELRDVMLGWELEGGKSVVEAARATVERLTSRSTLSAAVAERDGLEFLPVDPSGADYAMTGFAPISVLDTSGWVSASVVLGDLDGAVARAPQRQRETWTRWRRGKTGTVTFRFAILQVDRDWFSPQLYGADDWTLSDEVVSDGASDGSLPAYPARVYLVRGVSWKGEPAKPRPPAPAPPPVRPVPMLSSAVRASLPRLVVRPAALAVGRPKGLRVAPAKPARRTKPTARPATARVRGPALAAPLTLSSASVTRPLLSPALLPSIVTVHNRLQVARLLAARSTSFQPVSADPTLWAVGFGCESLPKAPNPHPGYSWN